MCSSICAGAVRGQSLTFTRSPLIPLHHSRLQGLGLATASAAYLCSESLHASSYSEEVKEGSLLPGLHNDPQQKVADTIAGTVAAHCHLGTCACA
jgi:hypothetical protein